MVAVLNGQHTEKETLNWNDISYPQNVPKDFEIYPPGNYCFRMKAGEKSEHWIRPLRGIRTVLKWASNNGFFRLEHRDGSLVNVSGEERLPGEKESDFRIHATDDTLVLLRVIEE